MADPLRLLAIRSEYAYVDRPLLAMRSEPEAVSAAFQRELTDAALRRARQRGREPWVLSRDRMQGEIAMLRQQRFPRAVASELRVLERQLKKIDRLID